MTTTELAPTARLRFIEREGLTGLETPARILQQWFAPDMPGYMRDPNVGEWRDVPVGIEAPRPHRTVTSAP
jgi:hypothetical protein